MNDATLNALSQINATMQTSPTDWQWVGSHLSQQMFCITEKRAKEYAERHGGTARKMN